MEATAKVVSQSAARVGGHPDLPQRIEVVIKADKVSVTKHLHYARNAQGGQYVGRAYDYRKGMYAEIAFPLAILSGSLTEDVRLRRAA